MFDRLIEVNLKNVHPSKFATDKDCWVEAVYHGAEGHYYQVILVHGKHRGQLVDVETWGTRRAIPMVLDEMKELAERLRDLLLENKDRVKTRTTLKAVDKYIEMLRDIETAEEKPKDVQVADTGADVSE